MKWTLEKPIIEGWYWYKPKITFMKKRIIQIYTHKGKAYPLITSENKTVDDETYNGKWYGPIEEPIYKEEI